MNQRGDGDMRYLLKGVFNLRQKLQSHAAVVTREENVIPPFWTQEGNFENAD